MRWLALFAVLSFGCAHVKTVATTCTPTADQVATVVYDLSSDGYVAALEAEAVKLGLCIVNASVDEVLKALDVKASLNVAEQAVVIHAIAWRATH